MSSDISETEVRKLCDELEFRLRGGERRVTEILLAEHPGMKADEEAALELIYHEVTLMEELEQPLSAQELCDRFPNWREGIRRLLEVHDALSQSPDQPIGFDPCVPFGTTIGKYKLLQEIGEGGFGVVYMAEQLAPVRRKVALKVIKPGMDTRVAIARFEAERQALAMMEHPNISRVLDAGATINGRPFFVMDLVRGIPITEYCDKRNLPTIERLKLFATVCGAVQHAHTKGIVHRDLKPTNIMITLYGGEPVPKIIDFGIAKALNQQLTEKTLFTRYGQMVGTPMYMSPEQAEMSGVDIDARSDIYSLGILLYELLTGIQPYSLERMRTASHADLVRMIVDEEPPMPSSRLDSWGEDSTEICEHRATNPRQLPLLLRGDLDRIVMKAVEKDRRRRYASVDDLARDIRRYLSHEPVLASAPTVYYRLRKFTRRNRALVLSLAAILLALTLGFLFSLAALVNANQHRQLAEQAQLRADIQRRRAEGEEANAKSSRDAERDQRRIAETNLYFQRIARAHFELASNDRRNAKRTLAECLEKNRNWEWHYLQRECESSALALRGHTMDAMHATVSPDGHTIASCSYRWNDIQTGEVILWDRWTGEPRHVLGRQPGGVREISFSPDSQHLAIVNPQGGGVSVWNTNAATIIFSQPNLRLCAVAFGPRGDLLATAASDGKVAVYDARSGALLLVHQDSTSSAFSVRFSPDGKLLAATNHDGELRIWNSGDGELIHLETGAGNRSLDFSPDGKLLATGGTWEADAGLISVFQLTEKKIEQAAKYYTPFGAVANLRFSPDGQWLAIASGDPVVRLVEPLTGLQDCQFHAHDLGVLGIAFTPDGREIVTCGLDQAVRVWKLADVATGTIIRSDAAYIRSVCFSPDGNRLALAGSLNSNSPGRGTKSIQIWQLDTEDGQLGLVDEFTDLKQWMTSVAFSPDGRQLAAAGDQGRIHVWDVAGHKTISEVDAHTGSTNSLCYAPDGLLLVSGGADGNICACDTRARVDVRKWKAHASAVNCVATSPTTPGLLASVGDDGFLRLWDMESGREMQAHDLSESELLTRVAFNLQGDLLATADGLGNIQLWEISSSDSTGVRSTSLEVEWKCKFLDTLRGRQKSITGLAFHPNGSRLASSSLDEAVVVWDTTTKQEAIRLDPNSANHLVFSVAFSPDGKRLAATHTSKVTLWNSTPRRPLSLDQRQTAPTMWHAARAADCGRRGNWLGAIFHYDQLLDADPTNDEILAARGNAHAALGN